MLDATQRKFLRETYSNAGREEARNWCTAGGCLGFCVCLGVQKTTRGDCNLIASPKFLGKTGTIHGKFLMFCSASESAGGFSMKTQFCTTST